MHDIVLSQNVIAAVKAGVKKQTTFWFAFTRHHFKMRVTCEYNGPLIGQSALVYTHQHVILFLVTLKL